MASLGINEIRWAKVYTKPQINPSRSIETLVSPDEYVSLLEWYLQLVPYLAPSPFRTSLSHPDLHLDNIFVDPETKKITYIIDWQSAAVSEPFFQNDIPQMLTPVDSGSSYTKLAPTTEDRERNQDSSRTANLLSHYQTLHHNINEKRWAATNFHTRTLCMEPGSLLTGAWSRNDVFSFHHALIHVVARWHELAPATTPCPIQLEEDELHMDELDILEGLREVLQQLEKGNMIPLGSMVPRENYEHAMKISNKVKEIFVDIAESESQRVLFSKLWPY